MYELSTLRDYRVAYLSGEVDGATVYIKVKRSVYRIVEVRPYDMIMFDVRCETLNGGRVRLFLNSKHTLLHRIVPRERRLTDDFF